MTTVALIGYARVSTQDQNEALQVDALSKAGCERVFVDKASGARVDRPELAAALQYLREGDVLVTWRLDRLGRSTRHLLQVIADLDERQVGFRSLSESIDSTSPSGRLVLTVFAAMAEFEKDLIKERTVAGLAAARARGNFGGRKPSLSPKKVALAQRMYEEDHTPVTEIAEALGVSRATIYRHLSTTTSPTTR